MVEDVECRFDWEGMFSFIPTLDREAGEFTIQDVMRRFGVSANRAFNQCRALLEAGQLETGERYDPETGRIVTAYWKKRKAGL